MEKEKASYKKRAESGEITTTKKMWLDFQSKYKLKITPEGFHKLLRRHGWRKVTPRTAHPKYNRSIKKIKATYRRNVKRFKQVGGKGRVRLMFSDEARFGRISNPKYT